MKWIRTSILSLMVVIIMALSFVGCGDDDDGGGPAGGATEQQSAQTTVTKTAALDSATEADSAEASLSGTNEIQGSLFQLVGASQAAQGGQTTAGLNLAALTYAPQQWDPNCMTISGGSATYNSCSASGMTINGTISVSGDTISLDLTITGTPTVPATAGVTAGALQSLDWTMKGSLTISDTLLSGTLDIVMNISVNTSSIPGGLPSGVPNVGAITVDYTVNAKYNDIAMTDGCATGGSLKVDYDISVGGAAAAAGAGAGSTKGTVNATFGPGCGDTKVTL